MEKRLTRKNSEDLNLFRFLWNLSLLLHLVGVLKSSHFLCYTASPYSVRQERDGWLTLNVLDPYLLYLMSLF